MQVTELLLFLARLYSRLDVSETTSVRIWLTHGGLEGREISAIGNRSVAMRRRLPCTEPEITTELSTTVGRLEIKLTENVKELLSPLFTLFDFFQVADPIWADIVDRFVAGEVA